MPIELSEGQSKVVKTVLSILTTYSNPDVELAAIAIRSGNAKYVRLGKLDTRKLRLITNKVLKLTLFKTGMELRIKAPAMEPSNGNCRLLRTELFPIISDEPIADTTGALILVRSDALTVKELLIVASDGMNREVRSA